VTTADIPRRVSNTRNADLAHLRAPMPVATPRATCSGALAAQSETIVGARKAHYAQGKEE